MTHKNITTKRLHLFKQRAFREALVLFVAFMLLTIIAAWLDLFETLIEMLGEQDRYEVDEIILITALFSLFSATYAVRRWLESQALLKEQRETSRSLQKANATLNEMAAELSAKQNRNEQLSLLINFLQVCKSKEEAFQFISQSGASLFPECSAALYVTKDSRNHLNLAAQWGTMVHQEHFSPDDCWGLRLGKRFVASRNWNTPFCNHHNQCNDSLTGCYPLIAYGEIIGLFHIIIPENNPGLKDRGISASLEQSLVLFAEQVSLSISNLELHQKLNHLAIHDPLTGLYNRHFLDETFEREIHRAKRRNTNLAIIMMDLDHFKSINDTYGHAAGDLILKEVGRLINTFFRIEDFCCRYGGEEFFVLLTDVDIEEVKQRCEAIRKGVENLNVTYRDTPLKKITVTLGVAFYPAEGENAMQLIEAADKALYRGKQAGRNRICFTS